MNETAAITVTPPCRLCMPHRFGESEMRAQIDAYLASLPEDMLVSEETYPARLVKCHHCYKQVSDMCVLCGCYVRTRAAKKAQECPEPNNPKWLRDRENSL